MKPAFSFEKIKKILYEIRFNLLIFVFFMMFSVVTYSLVRDSLVTAARKMGLQVAENYSHIESHAKTSYINFLNVLVSIIANSRETEESKILLKRIIDDLIRKNQIDAYPYAVANNELIYATEQIKKVAEYNSTGWYDAALKAKGDIFLSDSYYNGFLKKNMITIAKRIDGSFDAAAIDIAIENLFMVDEETDHSFNNFYLCDSNGQLIQALSKYDVNSAVIKDHIRTIFSKIKSGEITSENNYIHDAMGTSRLVFYNELENGWVAIITIPYDELIENVYLLLITSFLFLTVFLAIIFYNACHEYKMNSHLNQAADMLMALANSYYAIYRVNLETGQFKIEKTLDETRRSLNGKTEYEDLLNVICSDIDSDVEKEFRKCFSIENIHRLISQKIKLFGGEYKRKWGDAEQWIGVNLFLEEQVIASGEVIICFYVIEEQRQAQSQQFELLKSALERAKKSEEARNLFFSNMSHEMRTPLNAIIGLTDLAKEGCHSLQEAQEFFDKINFSSSQLLKLINNILELARFEQGKFNIEYSETDLKQAVQSCAESFWVLAEKEKKNFTVDFELYDSLVFCDSFRLVQVVNNILSNAFKYSKQGDSVSLLLRQLEHKKISKFLIEVKDTGIGMSKEFLDKIFVPYERESHFGAREVLGTGLGMPIVKNIVSNLGGEIKVTSELGKGTCVSIIFSFELVQNVREKAKTENELNFDFSGLRALIAEDNQINMEIAVRVLKAKNIESVMAWNGQEAVNIFSASSENYFDFILMDMQMPVMNGVEATKAIRALPRADAVTVPIIAVTANVFAEDVSASLDAGMNAHIGKPVKIAALYETLYRVLSGKKKI